MIETLVLNMIQLAAFLYAAFLVIAFSISCDSVSGVRQQSMRIVQK
jgi:hypothetical protein